MTERLGIEVHRARGAVTVVRVRGDVDAGAALRLRRHLAELAGSGRVQVDLGGVTQLAAEAVDVLVQAAEGGPVELLGPAPSVVLALHDAALRVSAQDEGPPRAPAPADRASIPR